MIAFLGTASGPRASNPAAFRQGLREAGYVVGENVEIEYRGAGDRYDRLPGLAADLVSRKVDVIVTGNTNGIRAAKGATSSIPIVFFGVATWSRPA